MGCVFGGRNEFASNRTNTLEAFCGLCKVIEIKMRIGMHKLKCVVQNNIFTSRFVILLDWQMAIPNRLYTTIWYVKTISIDVLS